MAAFQVSINGRFWVSTEDARASDPGGNTDQEILPVPLPEPSVLLVILFALPLLAVLERLRRVSSRA